MGRVARKLTPVEMIRLAGPGTPKRNMFLAPGDTWRCDCRRRWIFTPTGWHRYWPWYWWGMAYGKTWTPELLAGWETIRARIAGRANRDD